MKFSFQDLSLLVSLQDFRHKKMVVEDLSRLWIRTRRSGTVVAIL